VIFGPFDPVDRIRGITAGGDIPDAVERVPKFVLINTTRRNPDNGTLLHEMIHASFPGTSPPHDNDPSSLYSGATARDSLSHEHAAQLAQAFFSQAR
jgi:hypothetical protein